MSSLLDLVHIIESSPRWSTTFKQISRQPGNERWRGLCPFHSEKTPSFDVFVGGDGRARFYCHGCGRWGDAADWMRLLHGTRERFVPDPEIVRERVRKARQDSIVQRFFDVYPDASPEWDIIIRSLPWK